MSDDIVVTGLGVAAPNGSDVERYWESVLKGTSGITAITRFDASGYPSGLAYQIEDFDAAAHLPSRLLPQTDVSTRFALVAADQALADAGATDTLSDYERGVVTSNAQGGFEFTHREFRKLWHQGPQFVSVYESFAWFYAVNTGQISIRNGMRGPSAALVGEQAGGLDALGHGRRTVRRGTRLILMRRRGLGARPVGLGCPAGRAAWSAGRRIPAARTCRSTARPHGYVPGEGGAMLVIEAAESARERGAPRIHGRLAGYAATFDPRPGSGRPPGWGGPPRWPSPTRSCARPTSTSCSPTRRASPNSTGPKRPRSASCSAPARYR